MSDADSSYEGILEGRLGRGDVVVDLQTIHHHEGNKYARADALGYALRSDSRYLGAVDRLYGGVFWLGRESDDREKALTVATGMAILLAHRFLP